MKPDPNPNRKENDECNPAISGYKNSQSNQALSYGRTELKHTFTLFTASDLQKRIITNQTTSP